MEKVKFNSDVNTECFITTQADRQNDRKSCIPVDHDVENTTMTSLDMQDINRSLNNGYFVI